jgi:hypothetical protein
MMLMLLGIHHIYIQTATGALLQVVAEEIIAVILILELALEANLV